ncbi:MAG: hypothetical protein FWG87_10050 [Defluviitaleaceae bacterium]|nr:hypothetical protein [Defluviitaleaceae bacterium]
MVFLDNTARRPKQSEVISGRINPSPTKPQRRFWSSPTKNLRSCVCREAQAITN